MGRKCHPSRPPIPEEHEVNHLHTEAVKKRKEAAEAAADRKRRRKEKHDKACKIARAEGKPRPATPESTSEEEEAATGADSPPVYQEAGDEDAPAAPREARSAPGVSADPPLAGTERRLPMPVAAKVAHTGGGRQIIYARDRAKVAPASDGRGGPRAHDVDGRRWVRGEPGGACADGLEAPG